MCFKVGGGDLSSIRPRLSTIPQEHGNDSGPEDPLVGVDPVDTNTRCQRLRDDCGKWKWPLESVDDEEDEDEAAADMGPCMSFTVNGCFFDFFGRPSLEEDLLCHVPVMTRFSWIFSKGLQ